MVSQPFIWILATFVVSALWPTSSHPGTTTVPFHWPAVRPATRDYSFPNASQAAVNMFVDGFSGKHLYVLHCRHGFLQGIGGEEANFNGDFSCHMHSLYSRERYESLLIEDPFDVLEAHSRGEFWASQLGRKCGQYPEWGLIRSFRLRGMILRLEMGNVQFAGENFTNQSIKSFDFNVEVIPDSTALSAISEPPSFMPPGQQFHGVFPIREQIHCGSPLSQHVPGKATTEYVEKLGLNPPFASVPKTNIELTVDARDAEAAARSSLFTPPKPLGAGGGFVHADIKDRDGKVAYEFDCEADRITLTGTIPILAGNGLTCGLFIPGNPTNLLLDSVDPYTRVSPAFILPMQLHGRSSTEPGWGNMRSFSLRGLSLTLKFAKTIFEIDDDFGELAIVRCVLILEVEPNPAADTPVAKPPATPFKAFLPQLLGEHSKEAGQQGS